MVGVRSSEYLSPSTLNGVGAGLRAPHVAEILNNKPKLDWFELLADNHIVDGGWLRKQAYLIAELYPVTFHCVGMSIGGTTPLNYDYLNKIKTLANEVKPKIISDHLCWTNYKSYYSHDLLPLPFTEEALNHIVSRIKLIQDFFNQQIAIENISSYVTYQHSTINEVEFINAVAEKADCMILLDLNNVYVNHRNHSNNFQNTKYINEYIGLIDVRRIAEVHLAGFEDKGNYYLDSHNNCVHEDVWDMYRCFLEKLPNVPTLIEWDHDIPEFSVLYREVQKAKTIINNKTAYEYANAG